MNFSFTTDLRPDATVLAVTIGFCVLATLIFSLGPALKASRADVVNDLKTQGAESTASGRLNRFFAPRHVLVMAQMTLSLVLIFSAGLFFRGALKAGGLDLGFDPNGVVLTELDFSLANTPQADAMRRIQLVTDRVRALPGVKAVGWSTLVPYGNLTNTVRLVPANAPIVKKDAKSPQQGISGISASVTPAYFASIGVPVTRGRSFTELECQKHDTPRVCILDEGMAHRLFPGKDPIGQRLRLTEAPSDGSPSEMEVVGIVAPHRHDVMDDDGPASRVYFPLAQSVQRRRVAERALLEQRPGRRTGRVAGSPPRAAAARRGPADPAAVAVYAAPRQEHHALDGAARRGDVRHLRRHRAAAGDGWRLRREGVRRRASHARDRNPAGARRESAGMSSR